MHDVGGACLQDHLLVGVGGIALAGGDEASAEIGQVGAEHLCGENLVAVVDAAGQQQGLVEELADFRDQRERAPGPGVPARAGRHRDQAVDPGLGGFSAWRRVVTSWNTRPP